MKQEIEIKFFKSAFPNATEEEVTEYVLLKNRTYGLIEQKENMIRNKESIENYDIKIADITQQIILLKQQFVELHNKLNNSNSLSK